MAVEPFAVTSGKLGNSNDDDLKYITEAYVAKYKDTASAKHERIDAIEDTELKKRIQRVRTSEEIYDTIHSKFPGAHVAPATEIDEVYWSVSPKDATGSDRVLVDCHYDSPFIVFPTKDAVLYRVLLACNENEHVTTEFPDENMKVTMSKGDYHGFNFNTDRHCVKGQLPPGKWRVILKLHYIVYFDGSEKNAEFVRYITGEWNLFSRNVLNATAKPTTTGEKFLAWAINILRVLFNNLILVLVILVALTMAWIYRKGLVKYTAKLRRRLM
jgi:hypothetical protein